jgi:hypothetical protein
MPTKPDKMLPALYGGIIIAVVSTIPGLSFVNCLCCAGVMFGGLMAVYFYKNTLTPESSPLESSDGVQLGLLAGAFAAVIATVFGIIIQLMFGDVSSKMIMEFIERLSESGSIPPEAMDGIRQGIAQSMEGGLQFVQIMIGLVINIILFPIFGLFGGLIGVSMFKSKQPPVIQQPPTAVPMG